MRICAIVWLIGGVVFYPLTLPADDPPAPVITELNRNGTQLNLRFQPYPAAQVYSILSTTDLGLPFTPNPNFFVATYTNWSTNGATVVTNVNYEWRTTNDLGPSGFYRLQVTPLSSNALLAATVLNRLAYGPTPDELERVLTGTNAIGAEAYIAEQLAPWTLTEDAANTHTNIPFIQAKFVSATNLVYATNANIADFRAWHILRAVGAQRQLLEVLLQFLENHFVTQWIKSANDYMDVYYNDGALQNRIGAQFEYLENDRWRQALLNPQCTFHDLLKISAESPAMIIYLDTVNSKGNKFTSGNPPTLKTNVPNENYARELFELFTMGVDNGYDQNDIVQMSRVWSGWTVEKVDFTNASNPFAAATTAIIPGSTNTSTTTKSNLYGAWAFNYKPANHYTNAKTIFVGKTIPARFGSTWAGTSYQLILNSDNTTNGIQDGYQSIAHLANLPFTEEYISIKLCRLFVHDDFPNPSNDTNDSAYAFYNYAAGNLSPEADLVHRCMLTWHTNSPRGQIWLVLKTIFDSDLFRSHGGSLQKVKTPLEYTVSAIRALRSSTNGSNLAGSFTAYTDGYAIPTPLSRMGGMILFDRDAPDGYPEAGPSWISAGTLAERVRWAQSLCIASGQNGHSGSQSNPTNDAQNSICNISALIKSKLPASSWTNAPALADYFVSILYPGEGAGNLALYRDSAIGFLNDGSADTSPNMTPFASLPVNTSATSDYDKRVRGMVGMLMGFPRFQEQ